MTEINLPRMATAVGYFFGYNTYFGWNIFAKSDMEVICDGIALLIFALAFERMT